MEKHEVMVHGPITSIQPLFLTHTHTQAHTHNSRAILPYVLFLVAENKYEQASSFGSVKQLCFSLILQWYAVSNQAFCG